MYNYVLAVAADYTTTEINIPLQRVFIETVDKKQVIHEYDDGSIEVVSFSDVAYFNVTLQWPTITAANAAIFLDFYADTLKANARARTFYITLPDIHVYTVRFLNPLNRSTTPSLMAGGRKEITQVKLRVEGKKP